MSIHVDLITPERQTLSEDVDYVSVPTPLGSVGILPRHAPLLTPLAPGEVKLRIGDVTQSLAVTGGFLEVKQGSNVSIFAETAEFADKIDVERARLAAERAKAKLAAPKNDLSAEELASVEASLSRAILRIKIGERNWRKRPQQPEGVR